MTTFQIDVVGTGISFGYNPYGSLLSRISELSKNSDLSLGGDVKVQVKMIAMDFSLWKCQHGTCSSIAASSANYMGTDFKFGLGFDFSFINAKQSTTYHSVITENLRKIMGRGINVLAKSSRLSELNWSARVRKVCVESGTVHFDSGSQSHILPQQFFVIYAAQNDNLKTQMDPEDLFLPVAVVRTIAVYPISSIALITENLSERGVHPGDTIMFFPSEDTNKK